MAVWYPSVVINLKLRFDDQMHILPAPDAGLMSVEDRVRAGKWESNNWAPEPLVLATDETTSSVLARVPLSAVCEMPSHRQAGTFQMSIPWKDLPIDPRCVRAAAAEIHMGSVSADDFGKGMKRQRDSMGQLLSCLRTTLPSGDPNPDTLVMAAMVDEWSVDHSGSDSLVQMSGRDLRGPLLDTPLGIAPGMETQILNELDLTKPVHEVVADLLKYNPLFEDYRVYVNEAEWPDGVPVPGKPENTPRHRKPAKSGGTDGAQPGQSGASMTFWALIVQVCYLVGGIPTLRGTALWIRPAMTIWDMARGDPDPETRPTPFFRGQERIIDVQTGAAISPGLRWRRMVHGRDLDTLKFTRKFAGYMRPRVIRAVGVDWDAPVKGPSRWIVETWPTKAVLAANQRLAATKYGPGGNKPQEEIVTLPGLFHITDRKQLQAVARAAYEEMGRNELTGNAESFNLSSYGGSNEDPDLLRARPGDGVEILVDSRALKCNSPLVSTFTDSNRMPFAQAVAEVNRRLGQANLARVIVATARGQVAELQNFFRIKSARFTLGGDGIKTAYEFQNYLVARAQVEAASPTAGTAKAAKTPRSR